MNNLEKIRSELEKFGYHGFISDNVFFCGTAETRDGTNWLSGLCQVRTAERKYVCQWMLAQLPQEEEFADEKQLIDFIRKKFPIT